MLYLRISSLLFLALLLLQATQAVAALRSEAFLGEPFGVGRVTVSVSRGEPSLPLSDERFTVLEERGRVMYSVLGDEPARRVLRRLLKVDATFGNHLLLVSWQRALRSVAVRAE